ncbi:MAG: hypothetical protein OXE94_04430 [Aestuariivita sp.]|nr:hypothetical protein [Aestuariivita sp.]
MLNQKINFQDPFSILSWLEIALKTEREKYEACPVIPDLVPKYVNAQGWGYVVTSYFLIELALKAVLFAGKATIVRKTHSLCTLFNDLEDCEQKVLCEYYNDYRATTSETHRNFPYNSINDFLQNLDGDTARGSFDWRYTLIEECHGDELPAISIEYMHEIVFGCVKILEAHECNEYVNPILFTYSWRLHEKREQQHADWQDSRMTSDGYADLGDRLEILWGPDHLERYDLHLFKGKGMKRQFSKLPANPTVPIVDKKMEVENFIAQRK